MNRPRSHSFSILAELDPAANTDGRDYPATARSGDHEADELLRAVMAMPRHSAATVVPFPEPTTPFPSGRRHRRALGAAAATLLVVGGVWWLSAGRDAGIPQHAHHRTATTTPPAPSPPWRLASALSPSEFQLGTGNPTSIVAITCVGGSNCFLSTDYGLDTPGGGALYVSKDEGHSWSPTSLPNANDAITTSVSCASATWCAVGAGVLDPSTGDPAAHKPARDPVLLVTTDGGNTWASEALPLPVNVEQLPASGGLPAETTYWPSEVDAVSCSTAEVCSVLGQSQNSTDGTDLIFAHTVDGGSSWTSSILPKSPGEASYQLPLSGSREAMACPTAERCIVTANPAPIVGSSVVDSWWTTDGGATWQESQLPGLRSVDRNLSCPTAEVCWAGPAVTSDDANVLLHTTDGGSSWSQVGTGAVPQTGTSPGLLDYAGPGLSCTTAAVCYLTASSGMDETTNAGSTWSQVPLPSPISGVSQISCQPLGSCAAIAYSTTPSLSQFNGGSLVITDAAAPPPAGTTRTPAPGTAHT